MTPAVRLALVAAAGAWVGHSLLGNKLGAVVGAGGAVLLVETGIGRQLVGEGARLVREGRIPPLAEAVDPRASSFDNVIDMPGVT